MNINPASFLPSSRRLAATAPTFQPGTKTRPIAAWHSAKPICSLPSWRTNSASAITAFTRVVFSSISTRMSRESWAYRGFPYANQRRHAGIGFGDVDSIGDPTYLPSLEIQNTYSYSDNLTWIHDKHTIKFGGEIRSEEFTIFQPASPRGNLFFDGPLTDNPAATGTGGSGSRSFCLDCPAAETSRICTTSTMAVRFMPSTFRMTTR